MKKTKPRTGLVGKGRKRVREFPASTEPSFFEDTVVTLEKKVASLEKRLKREKKRSLELKDQYKAQCDHWWDVCPKGHLVRYDECDLMCFVTIIDPLTDPVIPSNGSSATAFHGVFIADLAADQTLGWWWRKPYGVWLRFKKWWIMMSTRTYADMGHE